MYFITKRVTFEASHVLPFHTGKCKNLHGHSYKVEVTLGRPDLDPNGFVLDFGTLNAVLKAVVVGQYDHKHLNDLFTVAPTAEIIASTIYDGVSGALAVEYAVNNVFVHSVRVWETEDSYASVVAPL